jgi:alanine racemase
MGDESHLSQIDVAEFTSSAAARAWVERRLAVAWARPGLAVFGSVDRGVYRLVGPETTPRWTLDPQYVGLDADVVDGRVCWRQAGR